MKVTIRIAAALAVAMLFLAGCQSSAQGTAVHNDRGAVASNATPFTAEQAQKIALDHAGLKEAEVTGLRVRLDKDNGRTYYDVEFRKGNLEYDYEINATTGKIIEWDKDIDN